MCPSADSHETVDIRGSPRKNDPANGFKKHAPGLWSEANNVVLLVALYCLQGVPLGLSMGSMPFLLQAHSSYTRIGLFGVAAYPYSCKLLWSPIVDSVFHRRFGRRRSWIVPLQGLSATVLFYFAETAENALQSANITKLSAVFFALVLLAATQDIAVDGWALTLLSRPNLGYTSMCQTIGMNAGFFLSFTVFLAFNDPDFSNRYLRSSISEKGVVSLAGYMKTWGVIYGVITVYIALFKRERREEHVSVGSLKDSYLKLWRVVQLPAVARLTSVLLLCRVGSLVAEAAGTLKLLEKGVAKESLAGIVLIQFPIELFSAVVAGKWVSGDKALVPFLFAYAGRLFMAAVSTYLIWVFPVGAALWTEAPWSFLAVLVVGVVQSFVATLMFTAQGAFFSQVSDPTMGGAYLTLLNSISNLGSSLPRLGVFWLMDVLTTRGCEIVWEARPDLVCPSKKEEAMGENLCTRAGGECVITKDGFYVLSYGLLLLGAALLVYFSRTLRALEKLPIEAWHVKHSKST